MDATATPLLTGLDASFVERIRLGDREAEQQLVSRTRAGLVRLLARRLQDRTLAEDLCHETYAIVIRRLREYGLDDPAGLTGFLAATARNLAIDHHRKLARRRTDHTLDDVAEPAAGDDTDPTLQVNREQLALAVRKLLNELPTDRDRELLTRFYLQNESKELLCEQFRVTDLHFNRILHRARQRFGELLQKTDMRFAISEGVALVLILALLEVLARTNHLPGPPVHGQYVAPSEFA